MKTENIKECIITAGLAGKKTEYEEALKELIRIELLQKEKNDLLHALEGLLNDCNPRKSHGVSWMETTDYIGSVTIPSDPSLFKAIQAYKNALHE